MFDLGQETDVQALGKTWRVGRFTFGVLEEFVAWVRQEVGDPFAGLERIIDKVPPEVAKEMVAAAQAKAAALAAMDISDPLIQEYLGKVRGIVRVFHAMLRQHHPEMTIDQAFAIAAEIGLDKAAAAISQGKGRDPNAKAPATSQRLADRVVRTGAKSAVA